MNVSIHQPDYIPYIGYFYKIAQSDIFIFLDDAQFSSDNMHHWNKIKTPQGELRLKIPVDYKFGDSINKVRTKDELNWKKKHLRTIEMNYKRGEYFNELFPEFEELINTNYSDLADMNIAIIKWICKGFKLSSKFKRASTMNIDTVREERVIDICLRAGGSKYISGNGAKAYQVKEHFNDRGLELIYTDYKPFEYKQLWKEFAPNMSIIDYIFNHGFDWDFIDFNLGKK